MDLTHRTVWHTFNIKSEYENDFQMPDDLKDIGTQWEKRTQRKYTVRIFVVSKDETTNKYI